MDLAPAAGAWERTDTWWPVGHCAVTWSERGAGPPSLPLGAGARSAMHGPAAAAADRIDRKGSQALTEPPTDEATVWTHYTYIH